ncbi:hypothetical protein QJS04_geneDACA014812 [Acorus gramineus]|uniref:Uncharacterized protein n=1 Tax=Acorus gramineus TaxID=55184 RepID=A0AAV9BPS1_ACOGR|nr:hypothetical protein QJS04_geneDACA014812 [Acorus gramineus]
MRQWQLQKVCLDYNKSNSLPTGCQMKVCKPYLMVVLTSNRLTHADVSMFVCTGAFERDMS